MQQSVPVLADLLDHDPLVVVDLGCSTGTSLIHLAQTLPDRNLHLIGVDNSPAMLKKCQEKLTTQKLTDQIQTELASIEDFKLPAASIVLMNYTLQFVPAEQRMELLSKIYRALQPNGFLLISEKVAHPQPIFNAALAQLYFEYKRQQGYSELEISRKRDALENVLVPLTLQQNLDLFQSAGFARTEVLLKWFNFATFICYPQ